MPISISCEAAGPQKAFELNLAFDTGAAITILDSKVIKRLGYDPAGAYEFILLTTASGVVKAPIIRIASIEAMGIKRDEFEVAAHSLPENANVDGLLGTDFMADLIVVLNFKKKWIEVKR